MFLKIMVGPPNHPFVHRVFHYFQKHPYAEFGEWLRILWDRFIYVRCFYLYCDIFNKVQFLYIYTYTDYLFAYDGRS